MVGSSELDDNNWVPIKGRKRVNCLGVCYPSQKDSALFSWLITQSQGITFRPGVEETSLLYDPKERNHEDLYGVFHLQWKSKQWRIMTQKWNQKLVHPPFSTSPWHSCQGNPAS